MTAIHHVALEIAPEREGECVAFYRLLGFEQVEPPASLADRAAWVERDGQQVHLLRTDDPGTLAQGHAAVVAERYEETLEALRAAGHDVEPRSEHWGSPRAFVHDPAGNLVEVMEFPPGGARG
jgi:catechol 2,3-dioxygenase-like lactoylglutathione lyase family enzyme